MDSSTLREIAVKVSQYFRDFLESDFKRQQAPRRRIILQSESGFRSGMRVMPYPALHRDIWSLLNKPSGDNLSLSMIPRRYTRPISTVLKRLIEEQVHAIPETAVLSVRQAVREKAFATYAAALNNPEDWVESIRSEMAVEVGTQLIRPLLAHLDGPLTQQAYSVIDALYAVESDLVARIADDLDKVLPEALAKLLATQDQAPLFDATENFLTIDGVHTSLLAFFETFIAADAFLEFRDLETYVATGDGLQLYLYVGTLKYRSIQYPLFFLPIEVKRSPDEAGYVVTLVNHLFVNRRAIDFVLQELAQGLQREWISPIKERITYLNPEQSVFEVARSLFRLVANAVDLGGQTDLSESVPDVSTTSVALSSALYLAGYERSDEALINDFEEIIDQAKRGGSAIVDLFQGLVGGVLMENPISISSAVESEWKELPLVDRMVFDAPIPLNEEQRKILLATRKPEGRIIVVEGPPGTGKSHTITAIAADCAFNKKSCLVLSDKTEALDVVQSKLTEAMSRVRHERDFPNPILRLGQQNANFKRLTSNQAVTQVNAYVRAMEAHRPQLEAERAETSATLKSAIERTVTTLGNVSLVALQRFHKDEADLAALAPAVLETLQRQTNPEVLKELDAISSQVDRLDLYLTRLFDEGDFDPSSLWDRVRRDDIINEFVEGNDTKFWSLFEFLDSAQVRQLGALVVAYQQLRMPILGYLLRGAQVRMLDEQLNQMPTTQPMLLKRDATVLQAVIGGANALRIKLEAVGLSDVTADAYRLVAHGRVPPEIVRTVMQVIALFRRMDPEILISLLAEPKDDSRLWPLAVRYLQGSLATRKTFAEVPQFDYVGMKTKLERLNTSVMNAHVDRRLVQFMENHRADAKALAAVISNRQKFPENKFESVRESFPVIIASIREFGEFMPLVPNLFDVVIIDEASQVSVAQALPALLRARKVVVLGDSKQFSNVKAANASIALNDKYRADLVQFFERSVSRDAATLQRLAMFDVKRSILEFCSLAASYSVMLRKHFRSYQELIGYSSGMFYGHQLQAIKIRGIPLDEVIRFNEVQIGDHKVTRGTNQAEADFILEQLVDLVDDDDPPTVGVITPFREQQTYLSKLLFGHQRGRDFEDKLRLKVMTFDTCQGEERNIIFYSMVATPGQDALNYIFPLSLENAQESVEEKLRVQRLNVGFSRAQEMIWIVHSMPLDGFRGAIGQALNYYASVLAKNDVHADQTDASSPMEAKVLDWLQKTAFIQKNLDRIEILPQFPIGDYLRQLDPTYRHPAWRVDFLVTFQSDKGPVHIVIEYDGFEHHFQTGINVHVGNHERYLVEADVERQLTLESYGYRFLRINRFNLGKDPVVTLSDRLFGLVEAAGGEPISASVVHVQNQAAGLVNKDLKPCTRCGAIQEQAAFFDPALKEGVGGFGRVCMSCKSQAVNAAAATARSRVGRRSRRWRR